MSTETNPIHVMDANAIQAQLAAPFPADVVSWKAQSVKNDKALAVAYIDARDVMDRLDATVGVVGWRDSYRLLTDGSVRCKLKVEICGKWVSKEDVGSPSEQPDGGDRLKAASSDALKRAAIKFGVGRYLYSLPKAWVSYDPQKKKMLERPQLPAWAIPAKPSQKQTATLATPQASNSPQATATVTDLIVLLKQLARIRGVDEVAQFASFIKSFAPNLKNIQEIPPDQMTTACTKVQKVIEKETEERGEY